MDLLKWKKENSNTINTLDNLDGLDGLDINKFKEVLSKTNKKNKANGANDDIDINKLKDLLTKSKKDNEDDDELKASNFNITEKFSLHPSLMKTRKMSSNPTISVNKKKAATKKNSKLNNSNDKKDEILKKGNKNKSYLSKQQLIGIIASVIFSCLISIVLFYLASTVLIPFIIEAFKIIKDYLSFGNGDPNYDPNYKKRNLIHLHADLTATEFKTNYLNIKPVLFLSKKSKHVEIMNLLNTEYKNVKVPICEVDYIAYQHIDSYKNDIEVFDTNNIKNDKKISVFSSYKKNKMNKLLNYVVLDELRYGKKISSSNSSILESYNNGNNECNSNNDNKVCENVEKNIRNVYISDTKIIDDMPLIKELIDNSLPCLPLHINNDIINEYEDANSISVFSYASFNPSNQYALTIGFNDSTFSGMGFHHHRQSWNFLLQGQKLWIIYKNTSDIPLKEFNNNNNSNNNLDSWLLNSYKNLTKKDMPIEIIQNEGEVVYIPEGWYHATKTLNIESISISSQSSIETKERKWMIPNNKYNIL
jgi:hypothetical protein